MSTTPALPAAPLVGARYERRGWTFRVACPLCNGQHVHGGGASPDPRRARGYLGHRGSHCAPSQGGGYMLTDPRDEIGKATTAYLELLAALEGSPR